MLLIIHGTSEVAEGAVANTILKKRPEWKHVPPEEVMNMLAALGLPADPESDMAGMFFAECVRTLLDEGTHVVQIASQFPASAKDTLEGEYTTVFIGPKPDGDYDHVISKPKASASELYKALEPILEDLEAT